MRIVFLVMICLAPVALLAQNFQTGTWGDQGNGTYINPVLNADYSDPDIIQVKGKYYMVCSEFHFMGIPVLESDDMVNWYNDQGDGGQAYFNWFKYEYDGPKLLTGKSN